MSCLEQQSFTSGLPKKISCLEQQSLTSGLPKAGGNLRTWVRTIPSPRGPPGNQLFGPDRAGAKAGEAGGGPPTVSLETVRKRPEVSLRLAATGWRSWGLGPKCKSTKRTRPGPWSRRRRGRQASRWVRRGLKSPKAPLGVNEKGGAGGRPGRRQWPLGCDCPHPARSFWLPGSSERSARVSCFLWLKPREGWLRLVGVGWARQFVSGWCICNPPASPKKAEQAPGWCEVAEVRCLGPGLSVG